MVFLDPNQRCEIIFLETDASTSLLRPITVLVADDHALIRSAISQVLTSEPKVEQVVMVKDYTEAEVQATKLCPNIIWLDVHIVRCKGIEEIRHLKRLSRDSRINDRNHQVSLVVNGDISLLVVQKNRPAQKRGNRWLNRSEYRSS